MLKGNHVGGYLLLGSANTVHDCEGSAGPFLPNRIWKLQALS